MSHERRRRLESAVLAIQQRHGAQAIRRARDFAADPARAAASIATGFPALDAITGCRGIPQGDITLFSGSSTSGKRTLAYKTLANAQAGGSLAVLLDLTCTADPDYLQRCGVALESLLIARPQTQAERVPLLLDLVQSRRARLVLVDGLPELVATRALARRLADGISLLRQVARAAACAVLLVDDIEPAWQRWLAGGAAAPVRQSAALHVELRRERWLHQDGLLVGYNAQARIVRSRWRSDGAAAPIEVVFNGTVHARTTW